ncbi:MAG: hypothetical protein GX303_00690 [Clostridiales bacterium]|nr:hypothetical protein [Clostridiales bacterium]
MMVGGIVGVLGADSGPGFIEDCYNSGEISGSDHVGGIAGRLGSVAGCTIKNVYNIGKVTATSEGDTVGAIAGHVSTETPMTNCYFSNESFSVGIGKDDASSDLSKVKGFALSDMKGTGVVAKFGFDSDIWKNTDATPDIITKTIEDNNTPETTTKVPGGDTTTSPTTGNMVIYITVILATTFMIVFVSHKKARAINKGI